MIPEFFRSALPWCSRSPWNPTWIATIYSTTSGRWWNPSAATCTMIRPSGRLERIARWSGEPRGDNFKCEVITSGLVDGHQAPLIPAEREVAASPYLQMPGDRSPLPRLTALAARWLRESGLRLDKHYDVARCFEQQLSSSGQFQYSLQGVERDTSIDAIEDFVSNNPADTASTLPRPWP